LGRLGKCREGGHPGGGFERSDVLRKKQGRGGDYRPERKNSNALGAQARNSSKIEEKRR